MKNSIDHYRPLVSVAICCFQVRSTVPMAIASLLAQTYQNWECLVIDDGSTDGLRDWIQKLEIPNLRYHRLEQNRGRGAAHQVALSLATGDFFCTLDGDDWFYPEKLQNQVAFLLAQPTVAAVSVGLAKVRCDGHLDGLSLPPTQVFEACTYNFSQFYFGTALVRTAAARSTGFRCQFRRSQDFDFFARLALKHRYATLGEVGYAYYYANLSDLSIVLEGLRNNIESLWSLARHSPLTILPRIAACYLKKALYPVLAWLGVWKRFSTRRDEPTPQFRRLHSQRFERVLEFYRSLPA